MKIKKLDHLVMYTNDSKATIQFYKTIGFTVQDAKERYILSAGDFVIHLFEKAQRSEPNPEKVPVGGLELCFELDNGLSMLKTYFAEQGISVIEGVVPRQGARGSMQSLYLEDPNGNYVEICCYQ